MAVKQITETLGCFSTATFSTSVRYTNAASWNQTKIEVEDANPQNVQTLAWLRKSTERRGREQKTFLWWHKSNALIYNGAFETSSIPNRTTKDYNRIYI